MECPRPVTHAPCGTCRRFKKAFSQIRIRQADRGALRFHWKRGEHSDIGTSRFTRALFGLAPSPFLLGGVIECHLDTWKEGEQCAVAELRRSLYVDDLLTGGATVEEAQELKEKAIEIFKDATFTLHKWQSKEPRLEESPVSLEKDFCKQLGEP